MPKKTKLGKGRLDKYYQMAKQQGYRSRASFKLIQINKKYNILSKAKVVIDLCAAPGGWLQVCEKFCPYGSVKIGVDLDKIPPIPGCKTFQEDITTPQCYKILKNELSGQKADVVLNDGAPNVGQNWSKDAFIQIELTLSALKLAVNFLRKGGSFITKVFRSTDYNALVYVMKKFFKKVEANKPLASRFASAEIFVCCMDFIAPDFIDEKLFDSKFIFKDTEFEIAIKNQNTEINSIDKVLEKRRKRQGYADDAKQTLSSKIPFDEYINAENPYPLFIQNTEIGLPTEEMKNLVPPPKFYDEYLEDLQVLGRRELGVLIKWRGQIKQKLRSQKQQSKQQALEEEEEKQQEDELDEDGEEIEEGEEDEIEEADEDLEESDNENIQEQLGEDADKFESGDEFEEAPEEEEIDEEKINEMEDVEDEQIKKQKKKELKELKKKKVKQEKQITNQGVSVEFQGNMEDQELFTVNHKKALKKAGYMDVDDEIQEIKVNKIRMTQSDIEENLERIYEARNNKKGKKEKLLGKIKNNKNDLENGVSDNKLKCAQLEDKIENMKNKKSIKKQNLDEKEQEELIKSKIFSSNWFDRDIFKGVGGLEKLEEEALKQKDQEKVQKNKDQDLFINPVTGQRTIINKDDYDNIDEEDNEDEDDQLEDVSKDDILEQKKQEGEENSDIEEEEGEEYEEGEEEYEEDDEDEDEEGEEEYSDISGDDDEDEMYIDETLLKKRNYNDYKENLNIDPNEKVKGEVDDDEAYKLQVPKSDMEVRRNKMKKLQKRLEKKEEKNKKDLNELNVPIEYVPETKMDDFDLETLAETRVLARKMLRKGQREALIDSSYSRYANDDDEEELPAWFVEDEQKHNYKHMPVTREEIKNELDYIKSINNRAPKKVLEAKIRKQKRLEKKIKRANEKVSEIFEQEGISEGMKIQQAKKLYAKSIQQVKNPKKKETVVARKFKTGKVNQTSKKTSYVDSRLRKDLKAQKRAETQRGNGGRQKSRNRQISRRKKKAHKY